MVVLRAEMKNTQVLVKNQSSIFQCNTVLRKADLVPENVHKGIANGTR